jgi:hypothetical protein
MLKKQVRSYDETFSAWDAIKHYFHLGENNADQLADYRMRAHSQIEQGTSVENT